VQRNDSSKVATFMEECRRLGIPILPPDVNYSMLDFDIQPLEDAIRGIRFGMAAVKNAGVAALQPIIDARADDGAFADLEDFCKRVDMRKVGKRTLESLIKVGAMRSFGKRAQLLAALERVMSFSANHHRDLEVGQMNMFGDEPGMMDDMLGNLPNLQEVTEREMLDWEKELLGLYVTGRPADKYREALENANTWNIRELKEADSTMHDKPVAVAGEVVTMRKILTRNNDMMCVVHLEDWRESAGTIDVVIFPRTWQKCQEFVNEGEIIRIKGKFDTSRGDPQVIAEEVSQNFTVQRVDDDEWNDVPPPMPAYLRDDLEAPPWPDDEADFDDEEPAEIAPAVQNGHTNGTSHTNGASQQQPDDIVPPPPSVPVQDLPPHLQEINDRRDTKPETPSWIYVYMQRSGDNERDQRRLQRVYNTLVRFPGDDQFSIVTESAGQSVKLDFKVTTGVCEDLVKSLEKIVGEGNIEIFVEN
jgi:DNA polymerase-3 subunit alpha